MKRLAWKLLCGLALSCAAAGGAHAQFALPEETAETKWGATAYGGGDVDSLGNFQFGIRANYRVLQVKPVARVSPELGIEVRKNYALFKAGGRADSREFFRLSGFFGGGVLRIQDFTNSSGSSDVATSSETWYYYFGGKLRLPSLAGIPLLGGILGGLPLEGVSLFGGQEINGLDEPPATAGVGAEFLVDEWYTHSVQFGLMVGSAGGFFE